MASMRALVMEGFGEPGQAVLGTLPMPQIGEGDILVRVGAVSLNPIDWKEMAGMLAAFYPPYPPRWVPGFDASGIVEAVGSAVKGLAPGDRVVIRPDRANAEGVMGQGVLAEFARVPQDRAAKVPDGLSHPQIACIATALRTAYQALLRPDIGVVQAGQAVLVDGASGGVGSYAVALARALGARVAGTCRPGNFGYVSDLGADAVFDYGDPALLGRLRRWAPNGIDIIIDTSNGGQKTEMFDMLAPGGRLIALATLTNDGDLPAVTALAESKGRHFHFLLMDYETLTEDVAALSPIIESGGLLLPEVATFPFDEAVRALEAIKAGGVRGKIVVEVAALV